LIFGVGSEVPTIIQSIGAKIRSTNLTTQLSDVEQQIRAELRWNQHDYQIWRIAQMKDEDYKELFSWPDQAKQQMSPQHLLMLVSWLALHYQVVEQKLA